MCQPVFAKSNTRFTREETILSVLDATDCLGKDQAVNVCKISGYVQRRLNVKACPIRMSNV